MTQSNGNSLFVADDITIISPDEESDTDVTSSRVKKLGRCDLVAGDLNKIASNRMLTDTIVHVAQNILKAKYPNTNGLQDPVLGQTLNYNVYQIMPFVQILHDGRLHWITISTIGRASGCVYLMDILFNGKVSQQTQRQICAILHCPLDTIKITALPVQQQSNGVDCGIFAIAFAQYLTENK